MSMVEHVTGDEKYEYGILKEFIRCLRTAFWSVYCENLRRSFFGILYLYL
jgi:hypothetical protein